MGIRPKPLETKAPQNAPHAIIRAEPSCRAVVLSTLRKFKMASSSDI